MHGRFVIAVFRSHVSSSPSPFLFHAVCPIGALGADNENSLFGFTMFFSIKYQSLILFFSLGNYLLCTANNVKSIHDKSRNDSHHSTVWELFFSHGELFVYVVCMDNCPLLCAPASALTVITHHSSSLFPLTVLFLLSLWCDWFRSLCARVAAGQQQWEQQ